MTDLALSFAAFLEGAGVGWAQLGRWGVGGLVFLALALARGPLARRLTRATLGATRAEEAWPVVGRALRGTIVVGALALGWKLAAPEAGFNALVGRILASLCALAAAHTLAQGFRWAQRAQSVPAAVARWAPVGAPAAYAVAAAIILELWGVEVAQLVAALGLLGVAGALVAREVVQDAVAGTALAADDALRVGDWILAEGVGEGVVERISLRSVRLRLFDSRVMTIPHRTLAAQALINVSRARARRIRVPFGLLYGSSTNLLRRVRERVLAYLEASDDFLHGRDDLPAPRVYVDGFSDSAIDYVAQAHASADASWDEHLAIRQRLLLAIKDIVEEEGGAFAYPTRTLWLENAAAAASAQGGAAQAEAPPAPAAAKPTSSA